MARQGLPRGLQQPAALGQFARGPRKHRLERLPALAHVGELAAGAADIEHLLVHVERVLAVIGLVDADEIADIGHRRGAHPHLEIAGVGQIGAVAANGAQHRGAHHHLGRGHHIIARPTAGLQPVDALPHDPGGPAGAAGRNFRDEMEGIAIDHAHRRLGLQEGCGPGQRARRHQIIGGQQQDIVAGRGPQPLVEGLDMAAIVGVADHLDPRILGLQGMGNFDAVVGGGIVHDDHLELDAGLGPGDAAHALAQVMAIIIAGNDDAHPGAGTQGLGRSNAAARADQGQSSGQFQHAANPQSSYSRKHIPAISSPCTAICIVSSLRNIGIP